LAARLDGKIPQQTIGSYETGEAQPDFAQVERLARALGVTPEWIAFGPTEPAEGDTLIGPVIERYKDDEAFVMALLRTASMHGEEGLNADLHFTARVALRLAEEAKGGPDHLSLRERVDRAVAAERLKLRAALATAKRERLQP
jgi:transcriptional regulator with XRE-family HTH domain